MQLKNGFETFARCNGINFLFKRKHFRMYLASKLGIYHVTFLGLRVRYLL